MPKPNNNHNPTPETPPFEKERLGGIYIIIAKREAFGATLKIQNLQQCRRHNSGFTLLEILIALFVFTILSMIVVSGLHSVTTTQATTEKNSERFAELQIALTIISRDFEQTVNRPITNINGLEPAFFGQPKSVSFTHGGLANPFGQLNRSTLQRTQYIFENKKLIRNTWPVLDHTTKINSDARTLLTHVSDLRFEYLDEKNNFTTSWPSPNNKDAALPKAVRIIIELSDLGKLSQLYVIPAQNPQQPTPEIKPGPNSDITT